MHGKQINNFISENIMKKYIKPEIEIVDVKLEGFLCQSGLTGSSIDPWEDHRLDEQGW